MNARVWFYEMLIEFLEELANEADPNEHASILRAMSVAVLKCQEEKERRTIF